jgi:RND superfamily putative drug exporter
MKKLFYTLISASASPKGKWISLMIWILLAGVLSSVFPNVNKQVNDQAANFSNKEMSVQAEQVAKKQFPNVQGTPLLMVWYRDDGLKNQDYSAITKLYKNLADQPLTAQNFIPPLGNVPPQALMGSASKDGTSIVTPIFMEKNASVEDLSKSITELKGRMDSKSLYEKKLTSEGLHVRFTGPVGISTDAKALFARADVTLLISTILIVLILLILLYRSPILAIVPLIGVGFAYGVAGPILGVLAQKGIITIDSQAVSVMTVLLFGAGTDYCLFLVSKYREYLHEEADKYKALKLAASHSGGAIFVSAITVVLSLCTLLLAQYGSFHRFAIPFSLAILIMGIAALTLIPALLAIFGRISFYPFIPRTEKMMVALEEKKGKKIRRTEVHGRLSKKLGNFVVSKPWTVIVVSVVLLGGMALFAPGIKYTQNLLDTFPKDMPSRQGFDLMAKHFAPGELAPVQVIVNTQGKELSIKDDLQKLSYVDHIANPMTNKNYQSFDVVLKDDPYETKAIELIPKLQQEVSSRLRAAGIQPGNHYWIGGETSTLYDTQKTVNRDMKVVMPVVIAIIAVLLLLYLRSIVAMFYLIITVLLSYLSAMGSGWALLHYGMDIQAITGLIPLFSFVFLVALGEDYNIFMISSIWKNRRTQEHRQAIAAGVSETSSVITSAGLILAATFAVLSTLPIQVLLQFGIVTAIGVLLDTFIVRPLLVPAITTVLGRFAFWPGALWKKDVENKNLSANNP